MCFHLYRSFGFSIWGVMPFSRSLAFPVYRSGSSYKFGRCYHRLLSLCFLDHFLPSAEATTTTPSSLCLRVWTLFWREYPNSQEWMTKRCVYATQCILKSFSFAYPQTYFLAGWLAGYMYERTYVRMSKKSVEFLSTVYFLNMLVDKTTNSSSRQHIIA